MANVIQLPDGRIETIFGERDFLDILESYMGTEARRWLEDWLGENDEVSDYIDDLEKETENLRARYREVMESLRKQSETIAALIREKDIDRIALSEAAGSIGSITWREINVR